MTSTTPGVVATRQDRYVLRYAAFTIFALGFIGGGTAIGIGVWTLLDRNYMSLVLGSELMTVSAWMLAVSGMLAVALSVLAVVTSFCAKTCPMWIYCILQGVVFTALIVTCILAVVFKANISGSPEETHRYMRQTIYDDYGVRLENSWNRRITESWDTTQGKLKCCAVEDASWDIYTSSEWYKVEPPVPGTEMKPFVPVSCCTKDAGGQYINEVHCQTNVDGPPGNPSSPVENYALHHRGCFRASKDFADHQVDFLIGTSLAVAFVTILPSLIFGIFMAMRGIPSLQKLSSRRKSHQESIMYPSGASFDGMHGYR